MMPPISQLQCHAHGYRGRRRPDGECVDCWAIWGRVLDRKIEQAKVRSVGRAKGGGRSSKAKGRTACVAVADLLRERLHLEQDDVLVKATSMLGVDLHLSPRAQQRFPFAIEVKNVERLNIWAAVRQAEANARALTPVVFFKRANTGLYVAVPASVFVSLVHQTTSRRV